MLSILLKRAMEGGFISGFTLKGRVRELNISHLLFADDTIVFCGASKDQVLHLSWVPFCFEASLSLKINLDKSEMIPIGEVDDVRALAVELGCRTRSFLIRI